MVWDVILQSVEICSKFEIVSIHNNIEFSFLVFEWIALNIVQSGFHMIYLILYIFKNFSVYRLMLQCWNWWNFSYKYQNLNWKIKIRSPSDRYSHFQQSNKLINTLTSQFLYVKLTLKIFSPLFRDLSKSLDCFADELCSTNSSEAINEEGSDLSDAEFQQNHSGNS